jgi:hypothetical protein
MTIGTVQLIANIKQSTLEGALFLLVIANLDFILLVLIDLGQ